MPAVQPPLRDRAPRRLTASSNRQRTVTVATRTSAKVAPGAAIFERPDPGGPFRMHRLSRLVGLAGASAALAASLTAGATLAAGSPTVGHVYVNSNTSGAEYGRRLRSPRRRIAHARSPAPRSMRAAPGPARRSARQAASRRRPTAAMSSRPIPAATRSRSSGSSRTAALQLVEVRDSNGGVADRASPSTAASSTSRTAAPAASNYTGFRLNAGGHLSPIAGSTVALPDDALPGHVLISPDGRRLVGTRVGPNAGPSYLDAFRIGRDGRLTAAPGSPFAAQRIGPFGSAFSPTDGDRLFVSNAHDGALAGSVSVYDVAANGTLTAIDGSPFADHQTAPCWVAISPDGAALFAVNTASGTVSRYAVATDGALDLAGSTALAGPAPRRRSMPRSRPTAVSSTSSTRSAESAPSPSTARRSSSWPARRSPPRRAARRSGSSSTDPGPIHVPSGRTGGIARRPAHRLVGGPFACLGSGADRRVQAARSPFPVAALRPRRQPPLRGRRSPCGSRRRAPRGRRPPRR